MSLTRALDDWPKPGSSVSFSESPGSASKLVRGTPDSGVPRMAVRCYSAAPGPSNEDARGGAVAMSKKFTFR